LIFSQSAKLVHFTTQTPKTPFSTVKTPLFGFDKNLRFYYQKRNISKIATFSKVPQIAFGGHYLDMKLGAENAHAKIFLIGAIFEKVHFQLRIATFPKYCVFEPEMHFFNIT